MIINPKFNTPAARERLRLIKKKWRSLPKQNTPYKKFRNATITVVGQMYQTRQMMTNMVNDIQMRRTAEIYNKNKIKTKLMES